MKATEIISKNDYLLINCGVKNLQSKMQQNLLYAILIWVGELRKGYNRKRV